MKISVSGSDLTFSKDESFGFIIQMQINTEVSGFNTSDICPPAYRWRVPHLQARCAQNRCAMLQYYYSIPPLIEYPLIEYSNLLNTEVVHRLDSLPKIIKFKGCIQFDLLNTKISGPFFQSCTERFLTRVEWHQLPRSVSWYAAVYSMYSGPTLWTPAATVNRHNSSQLDTKLSYK